MMTLATRTGDVLGEFRSHVEAIDHLLDTHSTGLYALAGMDDYGAFRARWISVAEAGGMASGMAVVHLLGPTGERTHYTSTPFPRREKAAV